MEQVKMICSKCKAEIEDEQEYVDNDGVCDDCFAIPIKKRVGKMK